MAQGDAMIMTTETLTSYGGFDTDGGSGTATGWANEQDAHVTAHTPAIDAGEQRTGAGCQKFTITTDATGILDFYSNISLLGRSDMNGYGHDNSTFTCTVYAKRGADLAQSVAIQIQELNISSAQLTTHTSDYTVLTAAYQAITLSAAITENATAILRLTVKCKCTGAQTDAIFYIDDVSIAETYTFAKNPSMPEGSNVNRETKQSRLADRALKTFTYPNSGYKHDGRLTFGLINETQMLALRSLWLWDKQITWTPNLNKLPSTLNIRLGNKWDFVPASVNLAAGYRGIIEWDEV